jgi:large subunit ribosomal protein L25
MDKIELVAEKRTVTGKKNKALRAAGKVPAVVYGHGVSSEPLELEGKSVERVYRTAGGNKIVALKVGGGRAKNVLFHDVQHSSARGEITHVDFYVVKMNELLKADIPVHFTGESNAVFQGEGTLMKNLESVGVECLPGDLPDALEVDISVLDDFEKTITLADLKLPDDVKLVDEDLTTLVAKVEPPRSEEEMAELEETVEAELPEGVAEEDPIVVSEENEGDADRRDKK